MDILVLFAQGNERLTLYQNNGNLNFSEHTIIQFPAVYGSSYFEIVDFNEDGNPDIVYCNGDNGDFSNITKPYHAIRIFENDGSGNVQEVWTYPMPGAWKTVSKDFDHDGDFDIAAISLFPDNSGQSFVYLKNNGNYKFEPGQISADGKWMEIEAFDKDDDGDLDLVLGAFNLDKIQESPGASQDTTTQLLFLENLSD
jgi:hypothetical protein